MGLAEIAVVFDETVEVPIDAVSIWSVAGGLVPRVGTSYDIGTSTLTITLETPKMIPRAVKTDRSLCSARLRTPRAMVRLNR